MRTQPTSVGTCYSEAGGTRLGREPGPCRWRCFQQSLQALTNLWEEAEPQREGLGGHLSVFLRCGRTTGPLRPRLRVQGGGALGTRPL